MAHRQYHSRVVRSMSGEGLVRKSQKWGHNARPVDMFGQWLVIMAICVKT